MADPNKSSDDILPHLSLFAGFCKPAPDTLRPDLMRDGHLRNPNRDGNINAMSQAEIDALPAWLDAEDEPEDHQQQHRRAPPKYNPYDDSCFTPLLPRSAPDQVYEDEEEAHCGFWRERVPTYDSILTSFPRLRESYPEKREARKIEKKKSLWVLCCFWCAITIGMLAVIGVAFAMDLSASQHGYGTGVAALMLQGLPSLSTSGQPHKMRFCLSTPNRSAPSSQIWRYMAPGSPTECTTEIVTLVADAAEQGKLHTSDRIRFGEDVGAHDTRRDAQTEDTQAPVTVEDRIRALELGDNIAEEGVLGQM